MSRGEETASSRVCGNKDSTSRSEHLAFSVSQNVLKVIYTKEKGHYSLKRFRATKIKTSQYTENTRPVTTTEFALFFAEGNSLLQLFSSAVV